MAALVFLAQTLVAVHGVVHLTLGENDHCAIAQFAPSLSSCTAAAHAAPVLPQAAPAVVVPFTPALRAVAPLRTEPIRGPPVPA